MKEKVCSPVDFVCTKINSFASVLVMTLAKPTRVLLRIQFRSLVLKLANVNAAW
jgi:hypothetical protein